MNKIEQKETTKQTTITTTYRTCLCFEGSINNGWSYCHRGTSSSNLSCHYRGTSSSGRLKIPFGHNLQILRLTLVMMTENQKSFLELNTTSIAWLISKGDLVKLLNHLGMHRMRGTRTPSPISASQAPPRKNHREDQFFPWCFYFRVLFQVLYG